jgi:hypothetical protein
MALRAGQESKWIVTDRKLRHEGGVSAAQGCRCCLPWFVSPFRIDALRVSSETKTALPIAMGRLGGFIGFGGIDTAACLRHLNGESHLLPFW